MRFLDIRGTLQKPRRFVTGTDNVSDNDLQEPSMMARILRSIFRRLSELEGRSPPAGTEFEVSVSTAGASVRLEHNFGCQVRWTLVDWGKTDTGAAPVTSPDLVRDATKTTVNVLYLNSYVAGKAIIRVEPSQW